MTGTVYIPIPRFGERHAANLGWMEEAACVGMEPEAFFPHRSVGKPSPTVSPQAQFVINTACRQCPVIEKCAQYARTIGAKHGVWGGRELGIHRRKSDDDDD